MVENGGFSISFVEGGGVSNLCIVIGEGGVGMFGSVWFGGSVC